MSRYSIRVAPLLFALLAVPAAAQEISEHDFFGDLPVVLSVSRLAQPLNEVPGAVTVIDRELIRRSGAREVADVLRLVPGFVVTHRNGANPLAAYHSALDVYGARMQVYVDGRSVYSPYYLGDTHRGLMGVVLEDIERIEVLRGSNSAAFGGNAFLGVINIVTQHSADTHGVMLSATTGDKRVDDNVARVGGGDETASFRITASRRSDSGLNKVFDDSHLAQLHVRGDFRPSPDTDVTVTLGAVSQSYGEGVAASPCTVSGFAFRCDTNKERTNLARNGYAHLQWNRIISADESIRWSFSHEQEYLRDNFLAERFAVVPFPAPLAALNYHYATTDVGGKGLRQSIEGQHTLRLAPSVRLVWGAEARREEVVSAPAFSTSSSFSQQQFRLFGNLEWRALADLVLNGGGMWERSSISGGWFAPRLAANYHLSAEHTVRAAVSQSFRDPGLYELRTKSSLTVFPTAFFGTSVVSAASGQVKPEQLISQEIGYLGHFRPLAVTVDLRGYVERINRRIWSFNKDFVNFPGPQNRGFEYQVDWRPWDSTRLMLSEAHMRLVQGRSDQGEGLEAPHRTTTWSLFQKLPGGFDLTLLSTSATPWKWSGGGDLIATPRQLDVRLAYAFRLGSTRGETAVTVQAINGGHQEFVRANLFDRRAFASLRLDY